MIIKVFSPCVGAIFSEVQVFDWCFVRIRNQGVQDKSRSGVFGLRKWSFHAR